MVTQKDKPLGNMSFFDISFLVGVLLCRGQDNEDFTLSLN